MSKLLGNVDRLRWRAARGEDVAAEIDSRLKQVRKFRDNGILPSPGLSVFMQVDVDKSGAISMDEFKGLLKSLKAVYTVSESEIEQMMETMDSDKSGEIDEKEWLDNLSKLPALKTALQADLDPATGRLSCYRTPRQRFAKLLCNIDRLEYDASKGEDVAAELASRRKAAQRFRNGGVQPSAGIMVFSQIDKKKERKVTAEQLKKLFDKMGYTGDTVDD
eukprot:SAG31_NODE_6168_length_2140_cov_1.423322_2_plen_218_part_01